LARHVGELSNYETGRGYVAVEGKPKLKPIPTSELPEQFLGKVATKLEDFLPVAQAKFAPGAELPTRFVHDAKAWTAQNAREMPAGHYIYIVRDGEGTILKVGRTENKPALAPKNNPLDKRMGAYRTAQDVTMKAYAAGGK